MPTPESDRAARRRLVWLLLTRGDVGAEALRTDGLPALRPAQLRPRAAPGPRAGRLPPPPLGLTASCAALRCANSIIEGGSERRSGRAAVVRDGAVLELPGIAPETERNPGSSRRGRPRAPAPAHSLPSMMLFARDAAAHADDYDAGGSARNASASSKRASASSRRSPKSSRSWATR